MKKLWIVLPVVLLLCGCDAKQTFETLTDSLLQPSVEPQSVELALPQEAATQVMGSDTEGEIYLCDGYTLTVQTFSSGDLDGTLRELTGRDQDQLTVLKTQQVNAKCYETVWSAAGETGDQIGRLKVLDDGNYHYAVTVMADADLAGQLSDAWQTMFASFSLHTDAKSPDTSVGTDSQPIPDTGS